MQSKQQDYRKSWLIGGAFVAAAVIFFVVVASSSDTPGEQEVTTKVTCVIAARSVPYFAEAVSKGRSPAAVSKIGGVVTRSGCVRLVKELQANPDERSDVPIQAQTPSGKTTPAESVTLQDLFAPAPAPEEAPVDFSRALACIQTYPSQNQALLRDFCYKGLLEPQRS